jgi:orotidine-5'-phosphate decarboxylase
VAGGGGQVGILGVTVLTSAGPERSLGAEAALSDLSPQVVRRARAAQAAGCAGVICSGLEAAAVRSSTGAEFKIVTPGIRPEGSGAGDDQRRTVTPAEAVLAGADYIVVGRPVRDAADPRAAAGRIADQIAAALGQENMKK